MIEFYLQGLGLSERITRMVCRQRHDLVRGISDTLSSEKRTISMRDKSGWLVRGNVRKGVGEFHREIV